MLWFLVAETDGSVRTAEGISKICFLSSANRASLTFTSYLQPQFRKVHNMEVDVNNPKPDESTGDHLKRLCHGIVVIRVTLMHMHTACGGDSSAAFFLQEKAVGGKCLHFVCTYHSPVQCPLSRLSLFSSYRGNSSLQVVQYSKGMVPLCYVECYCRAQAQPAGT